MPGPVKSGECPRRCRERRGHWCPDLQVVDPRDSNPDLLAARQPGRNVCQPTETLVRSERNAVVIRCHRTRARVGFRGAELLPALMLPDFERADRIGEFWGYPESHAFAELLIDSEEDRTLRAVLVGKCSRRSRERMRSARARRLGEGLAAREALACEA